MGKRVIIGGAVKAIREARSDAAKAASIADDFAGSKFATACLMSHAHLCNIEAGRKHPPAETIYRIAAMLRVPVDAISYESTITAEAVA